MPNPLLFSAPDLARLPIVVNARAISLSEGVRAALAVAVIIALNQYLDFAPLREAALAALLTCIGDPGGPIRRRLPVLLALAVVGAAVTAGYALLRDFGPLVALPIGVFGLFCSSFARIYGQVPQQFGGLLSTVQILSLDRGTPSVQEAGILAAAFVVGALWAILLTLVIWRIYPFLPARRAVAEAYRRLSELVRDLGTLNQATAPITDAEWEAHARIYRRAAREAIEAARTAVMATLRSRGQASNRAAQSIIRLEAGDQILSGLIAMSDLLEHGSPIERRVAGRVLRRMRPVLLTLARGMVNDDPLMHGRIDRAIDAIVADQKNLPPGAPLLGVIDLVTERLRIAHTLAVPANLSPGVTTTGNPVPIWTRLIRPLRANLNWRSAALRHALRAAATASLPLAITMIWFTPYDHWLTITVVATMQPYFSLTYTSAIERILGTAAGGLIAAAVGLVCTSPIAIAAAMFPLALLAFMIRAVSLGLFTMALTPLIVLLVEAGSPETGEWTIALARAAFTTIGGLLAVAANFVLWPSREPDLVIPAVRTAIAAHGAYADADFSFLLGEANPTALDQARRTAGVTTNDLEALISRVLLEPGKTHRDQLETAMVVDAALRRYAGRIACLQHDPVLTTKTPAETLLTWRDWIVSSMQSLASGSIELPPRPPDTETDALPRIARQIELIAGAMGRLGVRSAA
jgi:uncharacterized membrane protein YccC